MNKELPKAYNPSKYEDNIHKKWEESGFFNPDTCIDKGICKRNAKVFSIVLPPPNATGRLHIGHAVMLALQDTMVRYHRMKGDKTLWVPGTDHASIATESKLEKNLIKKGIKNPKQELGRAEFIRQVEEFVEDNRGAITKQCRKMGSSLDWSREAYTLDKKRAQAVRVAFKRMYDDGIIYRGYRVVNWSVKGQSTCSDDELVHEEKQGKLYTFKYDKDFPLSIATTRPETKFGDTAVAVHPKGKYKEYIGKEYDINIGAGWQQKIKIVASESVEENFGTGVIGVTPAHSIIDFEIYEEQKLKNDPIELVQVINEDGKMNEKAGEYKGLTTLEARKKFVQYLKDNDLLEKEEDIVQNVSTSDRFEDIVEPLPKMQWWINVNKEFKRNGKQVTLKKLMQDAVNSKKIDIVPERFNKTYFHWIDNLRDWNISRQLYYGHRVPVWYKGEEIYVGIEAPEGNDWEQDPDTLDTWFSSGMWTFSTLGWPGSEIEIIASRHGDTDAHGGKFIGQEKETDFDLNSDGKKQAQGLAEKLKDEKIDIIFSADSKRALQTAEAVNKYHNLEIITDERLREYRFGFMNGKTFNELKEKYPDFPSWKEKEIDHQFKDEEMPIEVKARVESFLKDLKNKYPNKKVFIATHSGVLDFFEVILNKKSFDDIKNLKHQKAGVRMYEIKLDEDLKTYHPTTVMETGYDILFFWVARMILMTTYLIDEVPFKKVYLHGLVRDEKGRKMSKSLDNMIDPLDIIPKYGTDAIRLSLIIGSAPGNDVKLSEKKIASYRNFTNKLWNIHRYILNFVQEIDYEQETKEFSLSDKWILSKFNKLKADVSDDIENFKFSQAGEKLHDFTWNDFADWYLEVSKFEKTKEKNEVLTRVSNDLLKLWHPFMPFVTEVLWQEVGKKIEKDEFLMISKWPVSGNNWINKKAEKDFELIKDIIFNIRVRRAEYRISPAQKVRAIIYAGDRVKLVESQTELIKKMRTGVDELKVTDKGEKIKQSIYINVDGVEVYIPCQDLVDFKREKERLQEWATELKKLADNLEKKLDNEEFVRNAPKDIIETEIKKQEGYKAELKKLKEQIKYLK